MSSSMALLDIIKPCGYACKDCDYTDCVLTDDGKSVSPELVRQFTPKTPENLIEITPELIQKILREKANAKARAKYAEDIEASRAKGRAKWAVHGPEINARRKEKRMKDPEICIKLQAYKDQHRDHLNEVRRENYDPEKKKAYYIAHQAEIVQKSREYRKANREQINKKRRELTAQKKAAENGQ
jgi:hypothetical protein